MSLALCIPLAAHAELTAPQMKSAKADIASGKIPKLELNCPSVAIPSSVIRSQAGLDKMNVSLKAREACVQEIRNITFEPNLRTLVQIKFPKASEAQTVELTGNLVVATQSIRSKVLEDLRSVQLNAINMGRPFVLRTQLVNLFVEEAETCDVPEAKEWTSVSQAKTYLRNSEEHDACLQKVNSISARLDGPKFVAKNFAGESDIMRGQMLLDLPDIQNEIRDKLGNMHRQTLEPRIRAQRYVDTNGRTDKPYYKGGYVNEADDKDE